MLGHVRKIDEGLDVHAEALLLADLLEPVWETRVVAVSKGEDEGFLAERAQNWRKLVVADADDGTAERPVFALLPFFLLRVVPRVAAARLVLSLNEL